MALSKLHNYIAAHRQAAGLSQRELAVLIGVPNRSIIAKFETGRRPPNLRVLLALEIVFDTPTAELFAGLREQRAQHVEERIRELHARLHDAPANVKGRPDMDIARATKLRWLTERTSRAAA